jgi:FAD/FMN-containing dehydrogenase
LHRERHVKNGSGKTFSSWGRYPQVEQNVVPLFWADEFPAKIPIGSTVLPAAMGRSYGDVCLNGGQTVLLTTGLDRMLGLDTATGVLTCEAGVTLDEILQIIVPRGWFLPVVPGTKFVSIGGAIANDIHGKNHTSAGTFGRHVKKFALIRSDGERLICSPSRNPELFSATIGGLGLTGLIAWAEIQLKPVVSTKIRYVGTQFHGLAEFLALSASTQAEYTVAWLDCISRGKHFARGIFMEGDHVTQPTDARMRSGGKLGFPMDMPPAFLSRFTVGAFNELYFRKQIVKRSRRTLHYEPFFFPLDAIHDWNRMYGKQGVMQFQCVVPQEAVAELLHTISDSNMASFLSVLKVFGDQTSPGIMSFPRAGVTLSLDFPIRGVDSFALVDRLAALTTAAGGRMYPAKDSRMTGEQFRFFYPQWQDFARFIDPAFSSSFWRRVTQL